MSDLEFSRAGLIANVFLTAGVFFITLTVLGPATLAMPQVSSSDVASGVYAVENIGGKQLLHGGKAWDLYNSGQFEAAEAQFRELLTHSDPAIRADADLGLAYTLKGLNRLSDSRERFEGLISQGYQLEDCVPALLDVLVQLQEYDAMDPYLALLVTLFPGPVPERYDYLFGAAAWEAYRKGDYVKAEAQFRRLAQKNPDVMEWVTGLGYSLYQQEQYAAAVQVLQDTAVRDTHEIIALKQMVFRRAATLAFDAFLEPAASGAQSRLELQAAERFSRLLLAIDPEDATALALLADIGCRRRELAARFEAHLQQRTRSGEKYTSRLQENGLTVVYVKPLTPTTEWSLAVRSRELNTDRDAATGYRHRFRQAFNLAPRAQEKIIGNYFRALNGQETRTTANDQVTVYDAWATWRTLYPLINLDLDLRLGVSPLGGAVEPTPLFSLTARRNGLQASFNRTAVEENILSTVGLDDPYGDQAWGRVIKNSIELSATQGLGRAGWFTVKGGPTAYRGKNVRQNHAWNLDAAIGRTIRTSNQDDLTWGFFAGGKWFEHNSNFFTFGHGGYYSPREMLTLGPLLRYTTGPCRPLHLEAQVTLGWMWAKTEDAPHYPLHYEWVDFFTAEALADLQGVFKGETNSGPTASMHISARRMITSSLSVGALLMLNTAPDYREWRLGVEVRVTPQFF